MTEYNYKECNFRKLPRKGWKTCSMRVTLRSRRAPDPSDWARNFPSGNVKAGCIKSLRGGDIPAGKVAWNSHPIGYDGGDSYEALCKVCSAVLLPSNLGDRVVTIFAVIFPSSLV